MVPIPAFGHIRPEIGTVCRLVRVDPHLVFTVFIIKCFVPIVDREIQGLSLSEAEASRIRVVGIGHAEKPPPKEFTAFLAKIAQETAQQLRDAYVAIVKQDTVTCTATGKTFDYHMIPTPSTVFIDPFVMDFAPFAKETTPLVKVVACWITTSLAHLQSIGPTEFGGRFEWEARTKALKADGDQRTFEEIARSIDPTASNDGMCRYFDGIKVYNYERSPQTSRSPSLLWLFMSNTRYAPICLTEQ